MKIIFMMTKVRIPDIIFSNQNPTFFSQSQITTIIPELLTFVFGIYSQPIVFKVCFFWSRVLLGPIRTELIPSHSDLRFACIVSLRKYWWRSFEATLSETVYSRWRWDRLSILRRMGGVSWHPRHPTKSWDFRLNSFQKIRWHSHTLKGYVVARWWFPIFFIFTHKKGEDEPILTSIFFKWVGYHIF